MRKKLYLVGIDSTPLWILKELSSEKGMEDISKLIEGGYFHELESTLPPMTGPAWPTIYTGLTPAEHGVPDFFAMKDDYTPDIVYYNPEKTPPFWEQLATRGYRSLLITPATDTRLPSSPNVDIITGFPLKAKTNSPTLEKLMKKYKFDGEPDIEKDIKDGKMTETEATKIFAESVSTRISIAKEAMSKTNYDFVFVCFTETDRLQHFVMNKENRKAYLLPIYSKISSFLGDLMAMVKKEDSTLMVVSDHGMQPISSKFLINAWLVQAGYAKLKDNKIAAMDAKQKAKIPNNKTTPMSYKVRERLMRTNLRKVYDKLPHNAKTTVFKLLGNVASAAPGEYVRLHLFDYDMDKTRAFAAISNDPVSTIWINDSRFRDGIVKQDEKDKLKKEIMLKLSEIKAEDGSNLVKEVINGSDYYGSTNKFIAADIIVEAKESYTVDIFNFSASTIFMKPEAAKSGDHMRHGVMAFYSKSAKKFAKDANVLNIAPTVLNYYGVKGPLAKNSILKDLAD